MNPWILAGALAMVISAYFYGHHEAYVEQAAEVARLNAIQPVSYTHLTLPTILRV